jgi:hypothetical protein
MIRMVVYLSLVFSAFEASAVVTKNCPENLDFVMRNFRQGDVPAPSVRVTDNDLKLPYAYIELKNLGESWESHELVVKDSGKCIYRPTSNNSRVYSIMLEGSLKEGAKNPAVMKTYFLSEVDYRGFEEKYKYVGYNTITELTSDKKLSIRETTDVYFAGEQCDYGDCIPLYTKVGTAQLEIDNTSGSTCVSIEKAKKALKDYMGPTGRFDFPYEDVDQDQVYYYYDFTKPGAVQNYVDSLNENDYGYQADRIWSFECAASTECWGGYAVDCEGDVISWEDGED